MEVYSSISYYNYSLKKTAYLIVGSKCHYYFYFQYFQYFSVSDFGSLKNQLFKLP